MGLLLLLLPLCFPLVCLFTRSKSILNYTNIVMSFVMMILGLLLTGRVILEGPVSYSFLWGYLYIDSLSALMVDIVLVIAFAASLYSVGYLDHEFKMKKVNVRRIRIYYVLMYLFIFTMLMALTVKNLGLMWIAIEATTLASAFLVGFYNDRHSVEAAWKYVIICSVGIAIALLGIVFLHLSSIGIFDTKFQLDWNALYQNAKSLKTETLRLSFIFILIGFGTKAGLAPMHTWLPDAHSQAPSPISAMLSGVLLNSAMYGIIRVLSIVNRNMGGGAFTGKLLMAAGLLSVLTASIFILTQRDYKRLLAYSSIEHMGIVAIALGVFSPISLVSGFLHMINHSFTKSMLFLSAGNVLLKYETREISKVKNLLKILPVTGTLFLLGLFAIAGMPPFSVFTSEFAILTALFKSRLFLAGGMLLLLLTAVFAGISLNAFKCFFKDGEAEEKPGEQNIPGVVAIVMLFLVISVTGFFIPEKVLWLVKDASSIVMGGK